MAKLEEIVRYGMYGLKRALFTTPMMYLTELISGMESSQSVKARALAAGVNFAVAMPYDQWFKPKVYQLMKVDDSSSALEKDLANRVAFAAHQLPLYAGILMAAGASPEQIAFALPTGVAVGVASAGRFQRFMDKVSHFVENKLYKAKERITYFKCLGKAYARNLIYASLIAASVKVGIGQGVKYVKEYNCITNPCVLVWDATSEGVYNIRKDEFDRTKHQLAFPEK